MTLLPSPSLPGEFILEFQEHAGHRHRAVGLGRAVGAREKRTPRLRMYFTREQAEQWRALHDAGFHAIRRSGAWLFARDPRPLLMGDALAVARKTQRTIDGGTYTEAGV